VRLLSGNADRALLSGVPIPRFLKLALHQVEHTLALGRVAAIAVAPAKLLQLNVQVPLSPSFYSSSSCLSVALGYPYVVAGV